MNKNIDIGGRLHSTATGNVVAGANEIFDDDKDKKQSEINTETYSLVNDINERLNGLSPDQQSALNVATKATNNEIKLGYYVCDTESNVAAKVISNAIGYVLSIGGSIKVKMTNANTVDNATLNINSTGAKPLFYDGERASVNNSWEEGETVEVYYDGTNFYANNVAGSGDYGVFDVSAKYPTSGVEGDNTYTLEGALAVLNASLSASKKKGGMSIKFIQSSDNKYVQYRYMGTATTGSPNPFLDTANWQGVDDEPTAGSNNLVKSGGVRKYIDTNIQTLPLLVSKYSIQTTTWAYNPIDDNKHLVIPVTDGDKITFNSTLQETVYYALLASYITPVLGATPDFVTGYEGRQSITKTGTLTIPVGTKYLIINNPHNTGLSELYVNSVSVFDGIWGVLHKFGGNITAEDLSFSLEQFEQVSKKTDEIVRSEDRDKFISQYGANNNLESIKAGLKGQKLYNLFEIKYRNFVTSAGVVPESDNPLSQYNCSDYIPVTFGNTYFYVLGGSSSISILSEFDSNKQLISNIVGTNVRIRGKYTPSSNNVAYVVLSSNVVIAPDYFFVDITNRLYAFKEEVPEVEIAIVSNNIANPANIITGHLISSSGAIAENASWDMIKVPVVGGETLTFAGFYLGRGAYYAYYNGNVKVSSYNLTDPDGTLHPTTVTVPENQNIDTLYIDIKSASSPINPYQYLQINRGDKLQQYDAYKEAITAINGISIESTVPSDLEERVEQLESDVEDLQGQVLPSLIVDLPVSADGSGIDVGYAYINSSTGVVTVKLS